MSTAQAPQTNQIGKRYQCEHCGVAVMCVRGGDGRLTCHGQPLTLVTTKPLPSSD